MAFSMTGFGRGESSSENRRFIVEIRTVNHRYCDVAIRMPRAFSNFEDRLRSAISQKIHRGKVEVYVNYEEYGEIERSVSANVGLAKAYIDAANVLKSRFKLRDDMSLTALLRLPDIFQVGEAEADDELIWALLGDALRAAMDALVSMRSREGDKLITDISGKLDSLASMLVSVEARAPFVVGEYRERLNARIKELLGQNMPDDARLSAEVALYADKCNIDEEILRFKSHLAQAKRCCESPEPVGRKFDFILQEINREVNTIGSKSNDLAINENVLEMKAEAEKIREQVQNLE